MKKIVSIFILLASILVSTYAIADDDKNNNNCVKFIYQKSDIGKGAVESGHYYTGPSGKVYLFPYWAQTPTPTPTPTICNAKDCAAIGGVCVNNVCTKVTPTPTPTPIPTAKPTAENAYNSCMQCHKSTDSKYTFAKWVTTLHQKTGHKSKSCTACHIY